MIKWNLFIDSQDGCFYGDYLFVFNSTGFCSIYDIKSQTLVNSCQLPSYNGILPHSNSVSFGKKMNDSDSFPLLYTNVYNNKESDSNTYGMCFVYWISKNESFSFKLVQIIKIDFTSNKLIWSGDADNIFPFGNFVVSGDYLWIYLPISGLLITRFFKVTLPSVLSNIVQP